ncbi:MAG: metal ABC transporter ATP-binding protein [Candidatus Levyibacteriota bacterium]
MQKLTHTVPIIELQNVSFSFGADDAVKNVSLIVHVGDYVGIIGPNGGGKSTLLKLMLGLLTPRTGIVKLFNTDVKKFNDWHKIGYVPQKTYFDVSFPVTVEEVVAMGRYGTLGLLRFPGKEDSKKVNEALHQVEMYEYKDRRIADLSGGQQQRVFIARALVSEPEVIFLDEPTTGVDVKTQKQFYTLLRKLNQELNLTLVLVSHELDVVAHESTELGYINRTLEYYGNPDEFLKGKYFHELIGKKGEHH